MEPVERVGQVGVQHAAVLDGDGEAEALQIDAGLHQLQRQTEHHHLQEVPVLSEPHSQGLGVRGVAHRRGLEPGDRDAVPVQLGEQPPSCVRRRRRESSSRGQRLHGRAGGRARGSLGPRKF